MPRRSAANRREVMPDAVYNNRLVTQLINKVLLDGKKSTAERIVYTAFDIVKEKTGEDPLAVFKKAMDNVRPTLEVKPKRVGGATYQVPSGGQLPSCHRLLPSAGWSTLRRVPQGEDHGPSAWPTRSWTPPTASAPPSSAARISSRWPRPNRAFSHYRF